MWEKKIYTYYSLGSVRPAAKLIKMYFRFQPAASALVLGLSGRTREQGPLGHEGFKITGYREVQ